jgi:transposase
VRHRFSLVRRRSAASLRLDALVELLGPGWADSLGSATASKTALVILEKYADPRALKRLGRKRLATLLIRSSAGLWREDKADELLAMASETLELWSGGGIDFTELAHDISSEVRVLRQLDDEITTADKRIAILYDEADPKGIVRSAPGLGPVLSAAILGNAGDFNRFANLAGVRSFPGFVPKIDQSGLVNGRKGITKAGDAGLRVALYMAADHARHIDPTLAQRYHRLVMVEGKHHNSALCAVSAVLITRIAACWRKGEHYQLRDEYSEVITEAEGKTARTDRFKIDFYLTTN